MYNSGVLIFYTFSGAAWMQSGGLVSQHEFMKWSLTGDLLRRKRWSRVVSLTALEQDHRIMPTYGLTP